MVHNSCPLSFISVFRRKKTREKAKHVKERDIIERCGGADMAETDIVT